MNTTVKELITIFKYWLVIKLSVPKRCAWCELLGLCRSKSGYKCGPKGCLLLWYEEHPSISCQPFTRKTQLVKEKAKPISLEELEEQIRRKEQSQDSNDADDS